MVCTCTSTESAMRKCLLLLPAPKIYFANLSIDIKVFNFPLNIIFKVGRIVAWGAMPEKYKYCLTISLSSEDIIAA